jgi:methionyl-tRNA synthetase
LLDAALETVGTDPLRHALCALRPETGDTDLAWPQVDDLSRTGLLGAIANPCYRVASLLWQRFDGLIGAADWQLVGTGARHGPKLALQTVGDEIRGGHLRAALVSSPTLEDPLADVESTRASRSTGHRRRGTRPKDGR